MTPTKKTAALLGFVLNMLGLAFMLVAVCGLTLIVWAVMPL